MHSMNAIEESKRLAGDRAAALVEDGMVVGLGSGSTAKYFVLALAARVRAGLKIIGVPTSQATEKLARAEGIQLATLEEQPRLDLTADGADEIDPQLNVTKGLGWALVREKIVANATRRLVIVAGETKLVSRLGTKTGIPVEVIPFGWTSTARALEKLGCTVVRRERDGKPGLTDNGNYNLLATFPDGIADPAAVEREIKLIPGVVDSGLFVGRVEQAIVAGADGVRVLTRKT